MSDECKRARQARHEITTEGQPIADQIMVRCLCGWRLPVSMWDHRTRDELWAKIREVSESHIKEARK